jgi:cephalosporin hydroxylase
MAIMKRPFTTFFEPAQLPAFQDGVLSYRYRGVSCLKCPVDIAIYMRLIWDLRPRTIYEIGSMAGGSALLLRDLARSFELDCDIVSIDLRPPALTLDGVRFLQGDVLDLSSVFEQNHLFERARPWLVIEDSAHTSHSCRATLEFFARQLQAGEHLVIEDGVLEDLGLSESYAGGPNAAIAAFLEDQPGVFEIASVYCDMFGRNATYNPNGYLKRLAGPLNGASTTGL